MAGSFNTRGSVLIVILYILIILSVLSATGLSVINSNFLLLNNENKYQQVYYITEAGAHKALEELKSAAFEAYEEIFNEYRYQPLLSPGLSMHQDHNDFVLKKMYKALVKVLNERGYLETREILKDEFPEGSVNVLMNIVSQGISYTRMLIIVRGNIGNIERRIDIQLKVNHKSLLVDSLLYDKSIIAGGPGLKITGGSMAVHGSLYSTGSLELDYGSLLIDGDLDVCNTIRLENGSTLSAYRDVASLGITASGEAGSFASIGEDARISRFIEASGNGNTITCLGNVIIPGLPSSEGHIGGILAMEGGLIQVNGDILVNTLISYKRNNLPLFGIEGLLPENGTFISGESIGGGNRSFYFLSAPDPYVNTVFNSAYIESDDESKAAVLIDYLENPPPDGEGTDSYQNHVSLFDASGVILNEGSGGYARGAVLANGEASLKRNAEYFTQAGYDSPDAFFRDIQSCIAQRTAWDFRLHVNKSVDLNSFNTVITFDPEGKAISAVSPGEPLLLINRDDEQLFLSGGSYFGIIYTTGALHIRKGESVDFSGFIAAEGGITVEGGLNVSEDRGLIMNMLENTGKPLQEFFKIYTEPSLITVTSFKEVLPDLRY